MKNYTTTTTTTTFAVLSIVLSSVLSACSSAPKEKQLLPDSGETTAEIMQGRDSMQSYYGNGQQSPYYGEALMPNYSAPSQYTDEHVKELQRDFKRVPNPEIIGYVYPHINNNEMPVPGYFTTFLLYDRSHFALQDEGYSQ